MKFYKIHYNLYIKPLKTHFGVKISDCICGSCRDFIKKNDLFVVYHGEKYYCRVIKKLITVTDNETAGDCFRAWFLEGVYDPNDLENSSIIPLKQKEFYKSNFLKVDENEFQHGFEDLEMEIYDVE